MPAGFLNEGVNDKVFEIDSGIIATFSGDKKLSGENGSAGKSWLASRVINTGSSWTNYNVRCITVEGVPGSQCLYDKNSGGSASAGYSATYALAPVVSLESGIKIAKDAGGDGGEDSPWVLTK